MLHNILQTAKENKFTSALAALALIYPLMPFADEYVLHVLVLIFIYIILALGLNIVPGFCGLLDLGFVGFYAIGAYTSGLLTVHFGLSYWIIIPLAALNGALWGVLLGAPTLRLTGDYFAIVTFGFSELVVLFIRNENWLTRGSRGINGIDPVAFNLEWINPDWYFEFETGRAYVYLALALAALVYFILTRVEDSRLGRAWFAIREDPLAAASCGVNILNYKVIAFAISAAVGALAGSLYARWKMTLAPDDFLFWESFLVLCMVVLGGLGNLKGSILGAVVLVTLGEGLRELLPMLGLPAQTRFLFYGLMMVLIMRFKPAGFFPAIASSSKTNPMLMALRKKLSGQGGDNAANS